MVSIAIELLCWIVGVFFILARFRFFYDPSKPRGMRWLNGARHASLTSKMCECGWRVWPRFWAWVVAVIEVAGGVMLLIPGWPRVTAAAALLVLLIAASACTARQKVMEQNPVDVLDVCCSYLWRVEGLYIGILLAILLAEWRDMSSLIAVAVSLLG